MENLAILVLSCDKYSSTWNIFFDRKKRYWPECKMPTYLIANHKKYINSEVSTINVGDDIDWSSNLIIALKSIKEENILLMIEDAPFNGMVNEELFKRCYQFFVNEKANYLNLKASPKPNIYIDNFIGSIEAGALYRAALVPSIWKKSILTELLVEGESAWHFEIIGSERSIRFDKFYSTREPIFNLLHYIIKGKIPKSAAKSLEVSNELNKISFETMSYIENLKYKFIILRSHVFKILVPLKLRSKIRRKFL
jgi:hypothetical protein